jgi:hypothetical protein
VKGIGDRAHVERSERSCRSIVSPIASVGRETKRCPPGPSLVEIDLIDRDCGT